MIFRADERGRITHMYSDVMPQYMTVRLDWYDTAPFHLVLALSSIALFLSMLPVAAIRALQGRRRSGAQTPEARGARIAGWIIVGISLLNLLFVVGTMLWGQLPTELGTISLMAKLVLGLGVVSAGLTVGALVSLALAWKNRYWGGPFRTYATLVTVAAVAFVWFLNYWNLLGWRY